MLSSDPSTRLLEIKNGAKAIYSDSDILERLAVCQAYLEGGLLNTNGSTLAMKYNNLFGIKKAGTNGVVTLPTKEWVNGRFITVNAKFGSNKTIEDSFSQHRQILSMSRYKPVWQAYTFAEAAQAIKNCGYATDPKYPTKLINMESKLYA